METLTNLSSFPQWKFWYNFQTKYPEVNINFVKIFTYFIQEVSQKLMLIPKDFVTSLYQIVQKVRLIS